MEAQEAVLACQYSEDETCMSQIIQSSFNAFLKKEIHNAEKRLHANIQSL